MAQLTTDTIAAAPTSSATTSETEPEVVAGISSAEGGPHQFLSIRVGGVELAGWRTLLLLGGGVALGYAAMRLVTART